MNKIDLTRTSLSDLSAFQIVKHCLKEFAPAHEFQIEPMQIKGSQRQARLFCATNTQTHGKITAKISAPKPRSIAKLESEFENAKTAGQYMPDAEYRVPKALFYHQRLNCALFEYVEGQTLAQILKGRRFANAQGNLALAQNWIERFQAPSLQMQPFDPASQFDVLERLQNKHRTGAIGIVDFDAFAGSIEHLQSLAEEANGKICEYAITHRDMHSGNLIFTQDNHVYGIDISSRGFELAYSDYLSLAFDLIFNAFSTGISQKDATDFIANALKFPAARSTPKIVRQFYLEFYALSKWAQSRMGDESKKAKNRLKTAKFFIENASEFAL